MIKQHVNALSMERTRRENKREIGFVKKKANYCLYMHASVLLKCLLVSE